VEAARTGARKWCSSQNRITSRYSLLWLATIS
jgi:hypothetical protein